MTQEATPVGGEATPVTDPADVFTKLAEQEFGLSDEHQDEEEEQPAEGEAAEGAEDELTAEEEADDLPPIDAPVSWDGDAKEAFSQLPRDLQETVAKREAERERFVQQKSQEAAQARNTVAQQAQAELAQVNASYAQQYQSIADAMNVAEPDPMLQVSDPVAYAQQMRAFQQANAQRNQAQQAAQHHAQQAQALAYQAEQAELAQQHQTIVEQFPEYIDPTTGPALRQKLSAVAKRIGYSDELISQARASDILAMRTVADALDKADKYDALQKTKMAKVRQARGLPKVATPGVSQGVNQMRANATANAMADLRQTGSVDAAAAVFKTFLS